jgi:hypothetical protein
VGVDDGLSIVRPAEVVQDACLLLLHGGGRGGVAQPIALRELQAEEAQGTKFNLVAVDTSTWWHNRDQT